mmetsp:Transcript_44970/g.101166  ORF Transcript_44970/g.101166 Transcript_44970/m.101166 type:complete len:230 (+) Transcript_44970:83-772(+)|eukprot:CAMPEP_0197910760 /NCGR_PEP_ID=MMETSP1439-20131203/71505_1 /TAXON_ID=66791 /ORGANISM="Gonyaulax spinifera, Strain CCMP409" /LENGTH=229 /DNA_ID=CAMNT_0043532443 /DNA_START=81 /DNA_END=770 /DNA_ORIENTATION=-
MAATMSRTAVLTLALSLGHGLAQDSASMVQERVHVHDIDERAGLFEVNPRNMLNDLTDVIRADAKRTGQTGFGVNGNYFLNWNMKEIEKESSFSVEFETGCMMGRGQEGMCKFKKKHDHQAVVTLKYEQQLDNATRIIALANMTVPSPMKVDIDCALCGEPCVVENPQPLAPAFTMKMPDCPLPKELLRFKVPLIGLDLTMVHTKVEINLDVVRGDKSKMAALWFNLHI